MEHFCINCNWVTMDNNKGPYRCPKCEERIYHLFDEAMDHINEYEYDDNGPDAENKKEER